MRRLLTFAAICSCFRACGRPFEQACWLRGYSAFLTDLHVDPAFAEALLEGITELDIGMWDAYLGAIGEHVQVVAQGDDVGMQDREYISPEMYRKYIFPRHKRLYDFIHSKTRAKLFMHSCGCIRKLIPSLIEADVRRNMEILMKGGGFVFSATHNIQHEIPPETTLRVCDTAVAKRRYG